MLAHAGKILKIHANVAQGRQKGTVAKVDGTSDRACLGGVLRCFYWHVRDLVME